MLNKLPDKLLNRLLPLNQLTPIGREKLSEKAHISQLKEGQTLSSQNLSQWYLYLLKGSMQLSTDDAPTLLVEGGSQRGCRPIFKEDQLTARALAKSPCHILRLEKHTFDTLLQEENVQGCKVVEVSTNEMQGELFKQLFEAYHNGSLELPTMPEVAMKIAKIADDPDAGIPEIAKIIQIEPTVAGSLIKVANSPLYRGTKPVSSIKNAIVRLGLKTTKNLATSIALRETFQVKSSQIKQSIHDLWEHSVNISALSYVIAQHQTGLDPERALMAGLLHDIGAIPILKYIERNSFSPNQTELEDTISKLKAMVGVLVINFWDLDPEFAAVVEESENWQKDTNQDPDYSDIVIVAHLYERIKNQDCEGLPEPAQIPAFNKLDLGPQNEDGNPQILEDAEDSVAEIKQMFNG
jgi:HD-like signal output (HDOD) protein